MQPRCQRYRGRLQRSQPVRVLDQDILDAVAVAADLQAAVVRHAQRRVDDRVVVAKQRRRGNLPQRSVECGLNAANYCNNEAKFP